MEYKRFFGNLFHGAKPHAYYIDLLPSLLNEPIGPIYVVSAADIGQDIIPGCLGMTSFGLAHTLRPHLESCGRWQGAEGAFCCIMRSEKIVKYLPDGAEPEKVAEALRAKFAGILLHEFAHHLDTIALWRMANACGIKRPELQPLSHVDLM